MENSHQKRSVSEFINLALKAMALAMGAVAVVLSILGTTTPSELIPLLAIGLSCLAISALQA